MKVVITGGAGFLGKKLARRILQQGDIAGPSGKPERVKRTACCSTSRKASGPGLDDPRVKALAGDISNFATVQSIVQGAATVFHFAAVVSAGAEADFDLGYRRQPRRHAQRAGSLPRARHQSARRLHQLAGGVRRRPAAGGDRRHAR